MTYSDQAVAHVVDQRHQREVQAWNISQTVLNEAFQVMTGSFLRVLVVSSVEITDIQRKRNLC